MYIFVHPHGIPLNGPEPPSSNSRTHGTDSERVRPFPRTRKGGDVTPGTSYHTAQRKGDETGTGKTCLPKSRLTSLLVENVKALVAAGAPSLILPSSTPSSVGHRMTSHSPGPFIIHRYAVFLPLRSVCQVLRLQAQPSLACAEAACLATLIHLMTVLSRDTNCRKKQLNQLLLHLSYAA